MLKIRALKLEIQTPEGEYGGTFKFSDGLNIIKGNNTAGKSTLFQSILFALGMEEMLGGRNAVSMQSALRDSLDFPKGVAHQVLESRVFLEIENSEIVTLERVIKGQRSSKLIRIHHGELLTGSSEVTGTSDTWIHDKGAAQNEMRGFHRFLEKFLGWELPEVTSTQGEPVKLYIQTIFPAFIVEQKTGWSDFLATIPFFAIQNAHSRALEFLLKMDVFETSRKRQVLRFEKESILRRWEEGIRIFDRLRDEISVSVLGISRTPEIISSNQSVSIEIEVNGSKYPFASYIESLRHDLTKLEQMPLPTVGENIETARTEIEEKRVLLETLSLEFEVLGQSIGLKREREAQYKRQLESVKTELQENKDVRKIYSLGGEASLAISQNKCPTCNQLVEDTLYLQDVRLTPMNIDDNIRYVEAQQKMIATYLENEQKSIKNDQVRFEKLGKELDNLRKEIRDLKTELISGEQTPSILELERRFNYRKLVENYATSLDTITDLVVNFFELSEEWRKYLGREKNLPTGDLSIEDTHKINDLETTFRSLLSDFGYSSTLESNVSVSRSKERKFLLPVAQKEDYSYNIRFDSSGSDLIRSIWAFYCSLLDVSQRHDTNHPKLLIFDEPIQQDVSDSSTNRFFKHLESNTVGQKFVFAAFGESFQVYEEVMRGLTNFKLIEITDRTIAPTSS